MQPMGMAETVKSNLNTILMCVTLGLLGWVTKTTQDTSVQVAKQTAALESVMKTQSNTDRELLELRTRITSVEISLASLKVGK